MEEKQTRDNTRHINIRLPHETYEEIEMLANKSERTISQQIRFMLQKAIEMMK